METNKITEQLESIEKGLGKIDGLAKDVKEAKDLAEKAQKELTEEVKKINEEAGKKGATLEQIAEEIKNLKAKGGRFGGASGAASDDESAFDNLKNGFKDNFEAIQKFKSGGADLFSTKTVGNMTAAANLTGAVVQTYSGIVATRQKRKLQFRDLAQVIPSSTGLWKFYRQNTPVGEGSFTFQTTHGAAKSQLDYDLTEELVTVDFLAGYSRIAKQMLQDLPFLQSFVSNQLIEDFLRSESANFFDTLQNGATGTTTTSASVTVEKIIDYVANLAAGDWEANGIVTTPAIWATILKTKPNDYSIPGGVTITGTGDVSIVGIPLYKSNNITSGKVLVGAWVCYNVRSGSG
jgi:HK97 family phage major capsid protein